MKRLLFSGCEAILPLMVAISFLVTDRLRYVMIVSIPDTIRHQELERKLFLKKTYCEVLHLKLRAIIARERLPAFFIRGIVKEAIVASLATALPELIPKSEDARM